MSVIASVPDAALQQRLNALRDANVVRAKRAEMKRDLKTGRVSVVSLIAAPPEWMFSMTVFDLLVSVPRFGRTKVLRILSRADPHSSAGISPSKTLGGLSSRQRQVLIDALTAVSFNGTGR